MINREGRDEKLMDDWRGRGYVSGRQANSERQAEENISTLLYWREQKNTG